MNKSFLNKTKAKLLQEQKLIIEKVATAFDVDIDGDEADVVQANMLISMQNELNARNGLKLKQILAALQRLEDKKYGLCEDCGEDIAEKRLLANPYFITCISCAEQREMEKERL
jgi:DnaK suppressor protein